MYYEKSIIIGGFRSRRIYECQCFSAAGNNVTIDDGMLATDELQSEWCGTVTYYTSCGFPIQDSYCSSWGTQCLIEAWDALDQYYCAP